MKNNNNNTVYHRLRKEIDKMPYGLPETKKGVEIEMLKYLFTPEEAEIALHLNTLPESAKTIYKRVKKAGIEITLSELEELLEKLTFRGAIQPDREKTKKKKRKYSYALLAIGSYEYQVDRLDLDFQKNFENYVLNEFGKEFHQYKLPQMRPVPVGKSITLEHKIATYDDMRKTIEKIDGQYAVMNCVCKQGKDLTDENCKTSDIRETCLLLPGGSWRFLEFGSAREITKKETLEILERAEETGLVIQPMNSRNPIAICCCCGDCCGILTSAKKFPKPAELFSSNYYAVVNQEICNGCSICLKRCQMEAITITDKKASVNLDRCIGCGLCVPKCKPGAVELLKKDRQIKPPASTHSYYAAILKKKIGLWGFIKTIAKYIIGKKA